MMNLKKVALVLSLLILLGIGTASAEITRGEDTFTGGVRIRSYIEIEKPIQTLSFIKIVGDGFTGYEMSATRKTYDMPEMRRIGIKESFVKTNIEINIDGVSSHSIGVQNLTLNPTNNSYIFTSGIKVVIPNDVSDKFKDAKRIALKFPIEDGTSLVYVLPDAVLAEWKEVINTEK
jgi:hypothetical protein